MSFPKTRVSFRGAIYPLLGLIAPILIFVMGDIIPALFMVVYWAIGIPFIGFVYSQYRDLFYPSIPLIILVFLYSMASILSYYNSSGITLYGDVISESSLMLFCVSCILGELGIVIGTFLSYRYGGKSLGKRGLGSSFDKKAMTAMWVLVIFFTVSFYRSIVPAFDFMHPKSYAEVALKSKVEMREAGVSAPLLQVVKQNSPIALLLATAIYMAFKGNVFVKLLGIFLLTANIFTSTLSGSRSGLFVTLAAFGLYFHYRVRRIRLPALLMGITLSLLLLNGISVARTSSNFSEMIDIVVFETQERGRNLLSISGSGELLVGLNLMKLIEAISSGESRFNYGKGFLDDVLCYIPRAFFPGRPLPLSERFVEEFYPGVRDMGGGYGLFFLQDGYWAFGLLGVFVSLAIYTWVVLRIYLYMRGYFHSDFMVLMYSFMYFPLVVSSPRSGLLLSFKTAAMSSLPFLLVLFFVFVFDAHIKTQRVGRGNLF